MNRASGFLLYSLYMLEFIQAHIIDAACLGLLGWYMYDGYRRGAITVLFELFGFILSLAVALFWYDVIGEQMVRFLSIPRPYAKAIGFFAIWGAIGFSYPRLSEYVQNKLPVAWRASQVNRIFGPLPAFFDGLLLLTFILSLMIALPFVPGMKQRVLDSNIGSTVVRSTIRVERVFNDALGGAVRETLSFLTVNEGKTDSIDLKFTVTGAQPLTDAERKMLVLANRDRQKAGLNLLIMDEQLQEVARKHGADMLAQGYFSHISKDGKTPSQRADASEYSYGLIGENLAFAPDASLAHVGLMDSPPHRANILSDQFSRAGIGVMDAGVYGIVVTELFSD